MFVDMILHTSVSFANPVYYFNSIDDILLQRPDKEVVRLITSGIYNYVNILDKAFE